MKEIKNTPENVNSLAIEFSKVLKSWLTPEEIEEINRLNQTADSHDTCASGDFCDANVAMLEAFEVFFKQEHNFNSEEENCLVMEAWDEAKSKRFFIS